MHTNELNRLINFKPELYLCIHLQTLGTLCVWVCVCVCVCVCVNEHPFKIACSVLKFAYQLMLEVCILLRQMK